jgi:hypothetical protein
MLADRVAVTTAGAIQANSRAGGRASSFLENLWRERHEDQISENEYIQECQKLYIHILAVNAGASGF